MVEENYKDVFSLNPTQVKWVKLDVKGDKPVARSSHTAIGYKNCLYVFGGVFRENTSPKIIFNNIY